MTERDKPHIRVPERFTETEGFTLAGGGGGTPHGPFAGDRAAHGRRLKTELESAFEPTGEDDEGTHCVSFVSFPGLQLALESLEANTKNEPAELLGVKWEIVNGELVQIANVFIPDERKQWFFNRLEAYVTSALPDKDKAKHAQLVEGIGSIRRATIRELWTDSDEEFPGDGVDAWWEVWLRKGDGPIQRVTALARNQGLLVGSHFLGLTDRTVGLVRSTPEAMSAVFASSDDIAELRHPHDITNDLLGFTPFEQKEWVDDLTARTTPAADDAPAVCILDRGVQQAHPLLAASLDSSDVHVVDPTWRKVPIHRHGTEMAGLALYGDIHEAVSGSHTVRLAHRLESVKFIPDTGGNDQELWGVVTAKAVDRPEIQAPTRPRVFMMAVTAQTPIPTPGRVSAVEAGKPTSWSTTVDALAYGRAIDDSKPGLTYLDRDEPTHPRLLVLSVGNIRDIRAGDDALNRSDLEPVEDPAQAWNALTVGAFTAKDDMTRANPGFLGYSPIAPRGELSPVSRTSVVFERKKWPSKPEVVAEGGNWAVSPDGRTVDAPENLGVLTTRLTAPGTGYFTVSGDTSAAAAHVAAIAGDIQAAYPAMRPETIRALIVHSAEWTDLMRTRFPAGKTGRASILRRYGMGVPDVVRACRSAADALTLVVESRIRPYTREGDKIEGKTREMNLHRLPWPIAELAAIEEARVRLRVTLSYFVEPNPSSRGWGGRYVYPSHGLRFAMKRPEDTLVNFRKRINRQAREDGKAPPSRQTERGWFFGSDQQQAPGSLHTDIWEGTARELSEKGAIIVYPVAGWWKTRPKLDQSDNGVDYSLVVSIESPETSVDLWTPVAQMVSVPVAIS
ncbi:MAG: S8 family peptidase [Propionibacteriaceae bacterium]|jgi:hypothetical protein|nr:S8 family peptidase [Propionibacteriaceae bacterium]